MLHNDIYEKFKYIFPEFSAGSSYYPNGKNSILIHLFNGDELTFTYDEESFSRRWKLEKLKGKGET